MVVIFNLRNCHLLTLSLLKEEVFQVKGQNRLVANLPVVDFHSQPREMPIIDPLQAQWFLRVTVTVKMTGLFLQISRARCKAEHGLHSSLVLILHICSPRDHPVDANRFKLHLSKYKKATLNLPVFNIQE